MSDEQKRVIEDYLVILKIRTKLQLEQCRKLMLGDCGGLEEAMNGYLDILIDIDKMERELKK